MKYAIIFLISIIAGYTWPMVHTPIRNHPPIRYDILGLSSKKVEIGCHSRFPMGKECIDSIVKRRYCDLDKLAYAVAMHETANCTVGTGKVNNCHGMLIRVDGKRVPIVYKSKQESYEAFKKLWVRRYGGCPDMAKADKYSGKDRSKEWLSNVNHYLYE